MMIMVSRTLFSKVRPENRVVFKTLADVDHDMDGESIPYANGAEGNSSSSTLSFAAKVRASLKKDHSMFSWANKGHWESVETSDMEVKRETEWFRIGFEPLFVDFTKDGSWFVVYTLIEVSAYACRGWSVPQLKLHQFP